MVSYMPSCRLALSERRARRSDLRRGRITAANKEPQRDMQTAATRKENCHKYRRIIFGRQLHDRPCLAARNGYNQQTFHPERLRLRHKGAGITHHQRTFSSLFNWLVEYLGVCNVGGEQGNGFLESSPSQQHSYTREHSKTAFNKARREKKQGKACGCGDAVVPHVAVQESCFDSETLQLRSALLPTRGTCAPQDL
jgi:hypothetical protein